MEKVEERYDREEQRTVEYIKGFKVEKYLLTKGLSTQVKRNRLKYCRGTFAKTKEKCHTHAHTFRAILSLCIGILSLGLPVLCVGVTEMTSLDRLGITGIRSFDPRKEQAIRFKKPLTIILGHNGAGKTTIVECIKMACTGDLPPFVDKGAAFIHDPRIQSDTETKGKIRLQFTDLAGRKIIVNRQFQLTNKVTAKKQEFKSVEQSVQIVDGDQEKLTLSQRHADVNRIVPELMGVTKAVLEHVVFVHQEESTWPLSDPKHLKEKFDEIFAATRYTKALDAIRKVKREKTAQLKGLTAELELWKEKVSQAEKLQNEYAQLQNQKNQMEEVIEKLEQEQQILSSQRRELMDKTQKWNALRQQIENMRAGKQSYISTLKDIYDSMEEEFVETDEEMGQLEEEIKEKVRFFEAQEAMFLKMCRFSRFNRPRK